MKVKLLLIGKTTDPQWLALEKNYEARLDHYVKFQRVECPAIKKFGQLPQETLKEKEGELLLSCIDKDDFLVLMDENGWVRSSVEFSHFIQEKQLVSTKTMVFCIGGAYGFSASVYRRANVQLSLSKMTFSHQMVRTIFLEQLYRAYTIIKGEKYHHL
jgi:23S rRNA (pseudouridine1915-N3)-methyltransferase